MWLEKIIHRKYELQGYNNPTDFFLGIKNRLPERKEGRRRIYLLGIQEHGNMGDQAITHAILQYVKRFDGYDSFSCTISELMSFLLPIKLDCRRGDVFVLFGGGNMGIDYFYNEEVRRLVIEMFPKNRVVIFPQTIDYGESDYGKEQLREAIRLYGRHRDLYIFAREKESYLKMKKAFPKNHVYLVPDIALTMRVQTNYERSYVLKCIRNDREHAADKKLVDEIDGVLKRYDEIRITDTVEPYLPLITTEKIREKLIERKLEEFARAKLVVTDRLHGMIFSVLTKTPCIILDNKNHKVSSTYETWFKDFDDVILIKDESDIQNIPVPVRQEEEHEKRLRMLGEKFKMIEELF